ncbi:MAG: 30S ribosomal protein S12 methylthiotransferase RimO [Candidatus Homeothermus sp.]|nr:30S ribosomal protein S12 methylthiotransferase RimO [Candidatus Homeothermus sp.]
MARKKVDVITLGCSKNLVDSERLLSMFARNGFDACHEPEHSRGDITVINTCGFIGDAKEESIDMILRYIDAKNKGKIKSLYVMGCLSQRYLDELKAEMPEVDGWYGKFDWHELVTMLSRQNPATSEYDRVITTPRHYAYIKIAEGCNRFCSFCAIPLITGRFKSRPIEEILKEVADLTSRGVKEFNIIAQDLSSYGTDLYGTHRLAELIDRIAGIPGVKWIRLHYAYPADFPMDILDVMAKHDNVCKYLDIALQHISDNVLTNMRRHINGEQTRELLAEIRRRVPGIHIRTTLMTGFPGEGEKEFEELKEFVREQRFERMGAFAYCEEEDTYGATHFTDDIPDEVKQQRLSEIMDMQAEIAARLNEAKIGTTVRVIVDREEDDYYVGRTEWDSPEVDQEVLIKKSRKLEKGEFYDVRIVDSQFFDLIAEI